MDDGKYVRRIVAGRQNAAQRRLAGRMIGRLGVTAKGDELSRLRTALAAEQLPADPGARAYEEALIDVLDGVHAGRREVAGSAAGVATELRANWRSILAALSEAPMTPTALGAGTALDPDRVSKSLAQMHEAELVVFETSTEDRRSRLYCLTGRGRAVAEALSRGTPEHRLMVQLLGIVRRLLVDKAFDAADVESAVRAVDGPETAAGSAVAAFVHELVTDHFVIPDEGRYLLEDDGPAWALTDAEIAGIATTLTRTSRSARVFLRTPRPDALRRELVDRDEHLEAASLIPAPVQALELQPEFREAPAGCGASYVLVYGQRSRHKADLDRPESRPILERARAVFLLETIDGRRQLVSLAAPGHATTVVRGEVFVAQAVTA
jgi:DNA-binding MarR family transcriptional regulator